MATAPAGTATSGGEASSSSSSSSSSAAAQSPSSSAGDPYTLLGVSRDATQADIRKAYFRLARRVHPDRGGSATAFQALSRAHGILADPRKRQLFDRTGCTDQDSEAFWEAYQQYRTIYPEVNKEDIEQFARKYRGSEEERSDLRAFYVKKDGDLSLLQVHIMLSRPEDAPRFVAFFEAEIARGALERTPAFDATKDACGKIPDEVDLEAAEEEDEEDEELAAAAAAAEDDDEGMSDFIVDDASDLEEDGEENMAPPVEDGAAANAAVGAARPAHGNGKKREKRGGSRKRARASSGGGRGNDRGTDAAPAVAAASKKAKTGKKKPAKDSKANKKGKRAPTKKGGGSDDDGMAALRAMMMARGAARHNDLIGRLSEKYG